MYIHPKGSPSSSIWILIDEPLAEDHKKGYLFSAPLGYVFDKMMGDAGIRDYYVIAHRPETSHDQAYMNIVSEMNHYKPPIIIPLGAIGGKLVDELIPKRRKKDYNEERDSEIYKYAGSLLNSRHLSYPHYVLPTFDIYDVVKQWKLRDIVSSLDLGKASSEIEYWRKNGILNPLPSRTAKIDFTCFDELLCILDSFYNYSILSNDIETIYPKKPTKTQPSQFFKILPGYPIVCGLAGTTDFGISFDLFRESTSETRELWKKLAKLFLEVPSLGQNFFNFDVNYYEALGFKFPLEKCRDTLITHHLLWPELKHTLQFQTRQYTREPYYKDEGHGWSLKNMTQLKIYNVKDVCVTLEVYQEHLKEMKERGIE